MSPNLINVFEAGTQKVIPAVLGYVRHGDSVLMIQKTSGFHLGKWNGLGGKCELNESPLDAIIREVREESGIEAPPEAVLPLGVLQFPNFKPQKREDWIVFVFTIRLSCPMPPQVDKKTEEGLLSWIESSRLMSLNLWRGDPLFLPMVLEERPFMGTIWYPPKKEVQNPSVLDEPQLRHWIQIMPGSSKN